jgi:hypothetical protein
MRSFAEKLKATQQATSGKATVTAQSHLVRANGCCRPMLKKATPD